MNPIYSFVIENSELSQSDRDSLITKRGFSDETIETFKLRSCGNNFLKLEKKLLKNFSKEELISSGIFIETGINPQLLKENILIPYLDKDGNPIHIRPHKFGFEGFGVQIFSEFSLKSEDSDVILTEGEFKAIAGWQYGFSTIAVPGIASFSSDHFPKLLDFLKSVKRVFIMFDNEVKDDPKLPNYKDNPRARYDTPYYAYVMAQMLERSGKETRIAVLPEKWMVNGKIDLDGASALGKVSGDIKQLLFAAYTPQEYLKTFHGEAKQVILKKLNQRRHKSHITVNFHKYHAHRQKGKNEWDEPISNFTMKILATHETAHGIEREICFVDEQGRESRSFSMKPEDMSGIDSFTQFCFRHGDYVWRGFKEDLLTIWESEFLMMDEGRRIVEPDHLGYIKEEKIWVFQNVAIRDDGSEIRPDASGIFWLEKRGVKPSPLILSTGKTLCSDGIPALSVTVGCDEVFEKFKETIGENEAKQIFGWIFACAYMEEIFAKYGSFPFLFITGQRGSGKSTIAEWAMNFFGLESTGKMISDTTPVAINRYLSYYSCLPVFIDEFRNTSDIAWKVSVLRNVYNRQSAGKGMKEGFGIREARVRGTILLSGEETPEDNALLTRCIVVQISEKMRKANHFNWFMANRGKFSHHFYSLLKKKGSDEANSSKKAFFSVFEEARGYFTQNGQDERTAINYATLCAGYSAFFGDQDINFAEWMGDHTKSVFDTQNEEKAVKVFLNDLQAMKAKGLVNDKYWRKDPLELRIFIYFDGLYNEWAQEFKKIRGVQPFKKAAIRSYLKEEPGFLDIKERQRMGAGNVRCISFDLELAPEEIKNLVEE